MKQIKVSKQLFNDIMKALKNTVAKDDSRPVLKKCYIKVDKDFITFATLDGFTACKQRISNEQVTEPFEVLIPVFSVGGDKRGDKFVEITLDEDVAKVTYADEDGNEIHREFKQPTEKFVDIEKIFKDNHNNEEEYHICVNPRVLINALKAFTTRGMSSCVRLTFSKKIYPILITDYHDEEKEGICLPMRDQKDREE